MRQRYECSVEPFGDILHPKRLREEYSTPTLLIPTGEGLWALPRATSRAQEIENHPLFIYKPLIFSELYRSVVPVNGRLPVPAEYRLSG